MSRGLLTHLADRFVTQREDLATEALVFILQHSQAARKEVLRLLSDVGCPVQGESMFRTQVPGDSKERPDISCIVNGREVALFEAKFWAGLTDQQPNAYLDRLKHNQGKLLVFITPEKRLEILWIELEKRVRTNGGELSERQSPTPGVLYSDASGITLAAATWTAVLSRIDRALAASADHETRESLGQLIDLCQREDTEAFLPVGLDELTGSLPRRLLQFCDLVDDVVARLSDEGVADTSGLRAVGGAGWYGRYVRLHELGCFLHVSATNWANIESTPLWLRVKDSNWNATPELQSELEEAQSDGLVRFYTTPYGFDVPLQITLGRDRSAVLESLIEQVRNITHRIAPPINTPIPHD